MKQLPNVYFVCFAEIKKEMKILNLCNEPKRVYRVYWVNIVWLKSDFQTFGLSKHYFYIFKENAPIAVNYDIIKWKRTEFIWFFLNWKPIQIQIHNEIDFFLFFFCRPRLYVRSLLNAIHKKKRTDWIISIQLDPEGK